MLTLTLVPLVGGVILIFAWSLDIALLKDVEAQIYVGFLMILLSFSLSNFIQKKWLSGCGWLLLMIADWLFLRHVDPAVQIVAAILAVTGVSLLLIELVRRIRQQARDTAQ